MRRSPADRAGTSGRPDQNRIRNSPLNGRSTAATRARFLRSFCRAGNRTGRRAPSRAVRGSADGRGGATSPWASRVPAALMSDVMRERWTPGPPAQEPQGSRARPASEVGLTRLAGRRGPRRAASRQRLRPPPPIWRAVVAGLTWPFSRVRRPSPRRRGERPPPQSGQGSFPPERPGPRRPVILPVPRSSRPSSSTRSRPVAFGAAQGARSVGTRPLSRRRTSSA